jgi:hypothetical protein
LAALAEPFFGTVRAAAIPGGLEAMGETLPDPGFSTLVGLVIYGYRQRLLHDAKESSGLLGKLWNSIRGKD